VLIWGRRGSGQTVYILGFAKDLSFSTELGSYSWRSKNGFEY